MLGNITHIFFFLFCIIINNKDQYHTINSRENDFQKNRTVL